MKRRMPRKRAGEEPEERESQTTFKGTRTVFTSGDSLVVSIPRQALEWTIKDSDIVGRECVVELKSDGTYRIELEEE